MMDSGDEQEVPESQGGRKKRYHRHTPRQIQELESMFKICPHPDEKQRMQLSRDLGLEPRQIKFWFQNRRTQMKTQLERADNCSLRAENDKIRCENIAMREALKNVICPSCGGPPSAEDSYFDEQKLRMENARLKDELDRVSSLTSKYLGRPLIQLPSVQPVSVSSLDLSMGGFSSTGISPSLDLDLLSGGAATMPYTFPAAVSDLEKPMRMEMAASAMEEVIRLVQTDEPLWSKSGSDGREVLHLETYERIFPRPGQQLKFPDVHIEASRGSAVLFMSAAELVNMFMDPGKWMECFPTIVSKAKTLDVLAGEMGGNRSGSLILMYEELQVLSPIVPTREFFILRYCQQIEQSLWVISDVSVDHARDNQLASFSQSRKLPSGCLIQDLSNGYSKITWVEHMEIKEKTPVHLLFRDLVNSGLAFGAQRWIATLQRTCERMASLLVAELSPRDTEGVMHLIESKRSMMKLAQRMVNNFCTSISPSTGNRWTTLSGQENGVGVRIIIHKAAGPGQPNGLVLSAATTIWLPISPERVFNFLKDEHARSQWDVLSTGNNVKDVAHVNIGSNPGNCVTLLRGLNSSQNNMLILQESYTDASESFVVYSPVDLPAINVVMSGEDTAYIPLLPSGFTILPDGQAVGGEGASTSSNPMRGGGGCSGSLVTVAFQILMSSLPSAKMNVESITTINNLIGTTVQQIKTALNCPGV